MKQEILIILGSPNSPSGVLGNIALSRLDYCLKIHREGMKILCTGGWGPHFNVSNRAHASFAKDYLVRKGIHKKDLLKSALSKNTMDDALKSKAIVANFPGARLTVITSDFHVERVSLIFHEILKEYEISFAGVKSNLGKKALDSFLSHEEEAIASIRLNGLYY